MASASRSPAISIWIWPQGYNCSNRKWSPRPWPLQPGIRWSSYRCESVIYAKSIMKFSLLILHKRLIINNIASTSKSIHTGRHQTSPPVCRRVLEAGPNKLGRWGRRPAPFRGITGGPGPLSSFGPGPVSMASRPFQGTTAGPGPLSSLGPGPVSMASRPFQGTTGGPGPLSSLGPGPVSMEVQRRLIMGMIGIYLQKMVTFALTMF